MEYARIKGNADLIKQASLMEGIKVRGIAEEVSKDLWQLYAFCSDEMITALRQKGLTVDIIKNNARIDHLIISLLSETSGSPSRDQESLFILIHFRGDLYELRRLGFKEDSVSGNTAGGTITLGDLRTFVNHHAIISIEIPRQRHLTLDKSVPDILANQVWSRSGDVFSGFTGKGVIVGIADTGIDFSNKNFIRADGTTRILAIWDQTLSVQAGEILPDPIVNPVIGNATLNYGVLYDDSRKVGGIGVIQAALNSDHPTVPVRHRDEDGHGTHVTGIAAGDGSQKDGCTSSTSYKYIGVAPEADIVVVRVFGVTPGDSKLPPLAKDGYGDAILFMLDYAAKRKQPIAVNISLGSFSEQMDGTGFYAVKFDGLLTRNSTDVAATPTSRGAAIIIAAGNNGDKKFHATAKVPPRGSAIDILPIAFGIAPEDLTQRTIKIIYPSTKKLDCQLTSALDKIPFASTAANNPGTKINGPGASAKIEFAAGVITITITPPPAGKGFNLSGKQWKLELKDIGTDPPAEIPVDAYIVGAGSNDPTKPFLIDFVVTTGTLSDDSTANNVITVGAYSISGARAPGVGQLAEFSSRGPTTDNPTNSNPARIKPEIAAPGVGIFSAKSDHKLTTGNNCCCDCCYDFYIHHDGTSQASPHVTGVTALMLQKNPKLDYIKIKKNLTDVTGGIPAGATAVDLQGWGKGKVNAKIAVGAVLPFSGQPAIQPQPVRVIAEPDIPNAWSELVDKFLRGPRGSELAGLFRNYFQEVRTLINKNKRVATVWHRNKGSLWVRSALYAAQYPDKPIPPEIEGFSLKDSLHRMAGIIKQYGSEKLQEAIDNYQSDFEILYQGMSLSQLVDEVSNPVPALA